MAPTATEITAVIVVFACVIGGLIAFVQAIKKEQEEREYEDYRYWHNL